MQFRSKTARVVSLVLTHGCNLHCTYCFERYKDAKQRMSVDTAKNIISCEISLFQPQNADDEIVIEYFGGEPLLQFDLIKEVSEYFWQNKQDKKFRFKVTTNGTLLDKEKKEWFMQNKDRIGIILSVDGIETDQIQNRGRVINRETLDFVRNTWPDSYFKSTMSKETLPNMAKNIIRMTNDGYKMAATIGVGIPWTREDADIYKKQLSDLADFYIKNPDVYIIPLFRSIYAGILTEEVTDGLVPPPNCGIMRNMVTYDVDGNPYPCHMFLPFVSGQSDYSQIASIDFSDKDRLVSDGCRKCGLLPVCRTCYGFNYNQRGDVNLRDKSFCSMLLAEVQVVSSFQINYLMAQSKYRKLSDEELLTLKVAVVCYQKYSNFTLN